MIRLHETLDGFKQWVLGVGDLVLNAWGIQKVSLDYSIASSLFTFNIPASKWLFFSDNTLVQNDANIVSDNGMMKITSGTVNKRLQFRRNPRYQSNRGLLYSSSMILDGFKNNVNLEFGCGTIENRVFFRSRSGVLYACRRWKYNGVISEVEEEIIHLPKFFNPEKGNIFDIQMQWRGVGSIRFYVGDEQSGASKLVYSMRLLNKLDKLSLTNSAMPLFFEAQRITEDGSMRCGCVDLSSEGGFGEKGEYGSLGMVTESGQIAISGFNVPILVVNIKSLYEGNINTRDILSLLASAYADQRAVFRVWTTRDETAITLNNQSWKDYGDGNIRYITYDQPDVVTPMTFNKAKAEVMFTSRVDMDSTYSTSALFEGRTDIYQVPGEYMIFTMHRETGGSTNVGVTYEFSELI